MDSQINEAIILAGGLGTRLRSEVGEMPKPLAPVNDRPFLDYLFEYLVYQDINKVILSVGYKWEMIKDIYDYQHKFITIDYAVEEEPLGTGGGIRLALEKAESDRLFVLNGDTFFDINLRELSDFQLEKDADCAIALKELQNVDRYGSVTLDDDKIIGFEEKGFREKTVINGGIYCVKKDFLNSFEAGSKFSFESEYLEKDTASKNLYGQIHNEYFKDIGVPEDYKLFIEDMG